MTNAIVLATDKPQLITAHGDLGEWIVARIAKNTTELAEAEEGLRIAKERRWATASPYRQVKKLRAHNEFLAKVKGAIDAGYSIVPNLDMNLLAVRIERAGGYVSGEQSEKPTVGAGRLPQGSGVFVSPEPEFQSWKKSIPRNDGTTREVTVFQTTKDAPVDVPFVLLKKGMADSLHKAMTEKLFDEIGVVRDRPKGDPVLVGRILHPKARHWDRRGISFFIGWWFDTGVLEA